MKTPDSGPEDSGPEYAWQAPLGFFARNPLIVGVLFVLLVGAGLSAAPFEILEDSIVPRDAVAVDAIPDIGENQQIVFTRWDGRSPRDIEDQVTYPLTTALLGIPGVKSVRSYSMLGFSSIYVIFEEGVEFYWSRSRVLEKLSSLPSGILPDGVQPTLGPDATALGQVFWYTLEGQDAEGNAVGGWDLHELRSIQDWTVRYGLQSVSGVSEVASIGGHVREYQIDVNPDAMRAHGVTLKEVVNAVRSSNLDVGARTMEINRVEYLVRGVGFAKSLEDFEKTVVALRDDTPIYVHDIGKVTFGPAERRGALDVAGAEAVGGVVVARYGENPMEVIQRVHDAIERLQPSLPRRTLEDGTQAQVKIVPFYDRSNLIQETLGTLSTALYHQILITIIVVLLMLRNLRSSLLVSAMLPLAVLATFIAMKHFGVDANIMSLAGIAIAIGTMVDMAIVLVENVVEHLEEAPPDEDRTTVIVRAAAEVAPAIATAVATTVVSFIPVFGLTAAEGKLFTPLAYTKTFALIAALGISLLFLPAFARLVIWPHVAPLADSSKAWLRSITRPAHIRDWVLVALGAIVAWHISVLAGAFVALVGIARIVRPLLPEAHRPWPHRIENAVAIVAMVVLLTHDWMPFGWEVGLTRNTIAVALTLALVIGTFMLFLRIYEPLLRIFLKHKLVFAILPLSLVVFGSTAWLGFDTLFGWLPNSVRMSPPVVKVAHAFPGFGREFMPPFDEGQFLYMPTTMPHASMGESLELLQDMDAAIQQVPEVEEAVGKLGRVDSALDPAPVSMFETIVTYKSEYRTEEDGTRTRQWRDHIRSADDIWDEVVKAARRPGLTSAPLLMPINTRIVMLQSGMRAPMGIKVQGPTLEAIAEAGMKLEDALREVPSVRSETVFAERIVGKPYLEIDIDRDAIARYGLTIEAVQQVIQYAVGGQMLTRTFEGRERYPVRVRYQREERDTPEALERIVVSTPSGQDILLGQLATIEYVRGPQTIKSEDTFLVGYVIFDRVQTVAETEVVEMARDYLRGKIDSGELDLGEGVTYSFAGSYENQVRSEERLKVLIPITLLLIVMLLYLQFRSTMTAGVIYTGVAVAISGGFILIWFYNQPWFADVVIFEQNLRELFQIRPMNLSVAVWVGVIALIGIATDDGVVMSTYLDQVFARDTVESIEDIRERVVEAGLRRVRPCLMTTATTILALLPVLTSTGRGADVMVPMAVPSVGGMAIELVTLFVVPVCYAGWQEVKFKIDSSR